MHIQLLSFKHEICQSVDDGFEVRNFGLDTNTAQKMKFSIKDSFSKCDQIRSFLWIWSHLLEEILNGKRHFLQWKIS